MARKRLSIASFLVRVAAGERSTGVKIASLLGGLIVFLVIFPTVFFLIARLLEPVFGFALPRTLEWPLAAGSVAIGIALLGWSTFEQWIVGRGTPAQIAPTQVLVTSGPYALCRNPIELGAVLYYSGVGTAFGSVFHGLVCFGLGLLVGSLYHSRIEEQELERRFGPAYVTYRQKTPFLIPRVWRF